MSDQLITATARPSTRQLIGQVGMATVCRFLFNTARRFPYPFAPALSRGLGMPLIAITSLIAVNQATGILSPIFGLVSDRWGYRLMMLISLGVLTAGLLAGGIFPFYVIMMLALFLAGLAKNIFDPALQAYLGKNVPYHRRGLVIGITEFGWAGSSLVGIPLVGLLIARVGWQSPFLILGGLSLLAAVAIAILIPAEGRQPMTAGAALNFREAWRLVRSSQAALGLLAYSFLIGLGNDNFFVVYGVWLEEVFALSVVALGLATSVIGAAELVGEGLTAAMADRLGLKRAVFAGLTLSTLSYLLLPLLGQTLPLALSGLFIVFALFEFAVVTTNSLATEVLPGARATMMSAMLAAIGVGRVIGALVGGPVWLAGGLMANCSISAATTGLGLIALLWGLRHWR